MRRLLGVAAVAAVAAVVAAGCATLVAGTPVSVYSDPFSVAGLPATDGPSGLRTDALAPSREVEGGNGSDGDTLAAQALSDIEDFWRSAYRAPLDGHFQTASAIVSWDSTSHGGEFCGHETYDLVNAMYCWDDNKIGWDRGQLVPILRRAYGDMSVVLVLSHEYGHAIQRRALLAGPATPTLVSEQQADCFAGVYMRWVAEGKSPRFTLTTGEGLNSVLATMISLRDPVHAQVDSSDPNSDEHGSAFERIGAFQFGFTDGVPACAAIDMDEIKQRRGDLPVALTQSTNGDWPVTEESVRAIVDAMNLSFSPTTPPTLTFADPGTCKDAQPSPPVSYCPATNTIAVDLPQLQKMAKSAEDNSGFDLAIGDNTAYSVLVSRYTMALQNQRGAVLDNAEAALRTACLTGVATTKMSEQIHVDGDTIQLAAGDVDEAVSGMLTNGLAASDVNGASVPSGFSRIDAFRMGVLGDVDRCFKRYP